MDAFEKEVPLIGGMSTPGVVRVGDMVQRRRRADWARNELERRPVW